MTAAWMKRNAQRQRFLEDLQREIIGREEHGKILELHIPLSVFLLRYLGQESGLAMEAHSDEPKIGMMFEELILPKTEAFARTKEESLDLISKLALWSMTSVVSPFARALLHSEHDNPRLYFEGREAMDDVPVD